MLVSLLTSPLKQPTPSSLSTLHPQGSSDVVTSPAGVQLHSRVAAFDGMTDCIIEHLKRAGRHDRRHPQAFRSVAGIAGLPQSMIAESPVCRIAGIAALTADIYGSRAGKLRLHATEERNWGRVSCVYTHRRREIGGHGGHKDPYTPTYC